MKMQSLGLKVFTDFGVGARSKGSGSRNNANGFLDFDLGTRKNWCYSSESGDHGLRFCKIVACSSQRNVGGESPAPIPKPITGPTSGWLLSRTETYAMLKLQMEVAAKAEDYKQAARIRDSLRSFEEEEPVLRLRRLLKRAIAEERFEDAARYRDELKEIAPHSLLKCASDATTLGIRVQVRSVYIEGRSQPSKGQYFFAYRIRITNNSDRPVQLLRRHWIVTDANGKTEHVTAIGVIGEQPVILPKTGFEYSSACPLSTPSGRMKFRRSRKMGILEATRKVSWQPEKIGDTNTSNYWLNWRVLLCAIWVLISMVFASYLISKYEGPRNSRPSSNGFSAENGGETTARRGKSPGILYADEVWKPCLKGMHPGWLLAFRVCGFFVLFTVLIVNAIVDGPSIFYYYTQWTFALVTLYFGLGSVLSMYGCYEYHNKTVVDRDDNKQIDAERGSHHMVCANVGTSNAAKTTLSSYQLEQSRPIAGFWGYVLQIIYQMNAGAVMLTDCVFWFIIAPFLKMKNYDFNFFIINMHTINLVFLLGDTALNCLRFAWFRIAYFILWTSFYVIFQWLVHACITIWWPYPFLDLSSPFAPLWYSSVAIMHFPCYGIFFLIIRFKHMLLSRYFPESYQCPR